MNLNKFNLSKFNIVGDSGEDIEFTMFCEEKVDITVTFSLNSSVLMTGTESLKTESKLTMAVPIDDKAHEEVFIEATGQIRVVVDMNCIEALKTTVDAYKNMDMQIDLQEEIRTKSYLSKDIEYAISYNEELQFKELRGNLDILMRSLFLDERLIVNTGSTFIRDDITKINVSLKNGETLEIDSDKFTAFKGENNVLDMYSGEWINISRELESITINSGSGGKLVGRVIVRERFL